VTTKVVYCANCKLGTNRPTLCIGRRGEFIELCETCSRAYSIGWGAYDRHLRVLAKKIAAIDRRVAGVIQTIILTRSQQPRPRRVK
jgi:hypothetical protein